MASEVSICNLALGWVGADLITSLNDQINTARLCKSQYPELRDAVLEDAPWTFAQTRQVLEAQVVPGPNDWGTQRRFPIEDPDTIANVARVYPDEQEVRQIKGWTRQGNLILASNYDVIYCVMTKYVQDPDAFSSAFRQALAARLAASLAIPIAKSKSLQADHWALYGDMINEAKADDGSQGANEKLQQSRLVTVRGS